MEKNETAGQRKDTRRLRISVFFLVVGLLIEAVTLQWAHPTAFLVYILLGGLFLVVGLLVYIYSLLFHSR